MRNQRIFELQKSILYHKTGLEKGYSVVKFSKTMNETVTIENPKTLKLTSNMVYANEKFLVLVGCLISLKKSEKDLWKKNIFQNVDWNYYQNKRKNNLKLTLEHGMSRKNFYYKWDPSKGLEKANLLSSKLLFCYI